LFGWLWERQRYGVILDEKIYAQVSIECALSSALYKNIFCLRIDELENGQLTQDQFNSFRDRSLVENVVYLYLNQEYIAERSYEIGEGQAFHTAQLDRSLDFAGCSLSLLSFADATHLQQYFDDHPKLIESFTEDLFDSNGQMEPDFVKFVEYAIEHYQKVRDENQ
jgi:hypothetical protein